MLEPEAIKRTHKTDVSPTPNVEAQLPSKQRGPSRTYMAGYLLCPDCAVAEPVPVSWQPVMILLPGEHGNWIPTHPCRSGSCAHFQDTLRWWIGPWVAREFLLLLSASRIRSVLAGMEVLWRS